MEQKELIYKSTEGISPFAYTVVGEWLYFCDQDIKALFRYHFESEICERVIKFNSRYVNRNFYKIFAYGDELWLLPFSDGKIVCFNMKTEEIIYLDVPEKIEEKAIPFIDMFFWRKKAYIAPHGNNRFLVEVDLEAHHIQEVEILKGNQKDDIVFFQGAVQFRDRIYLAESGRNKLVVFDIGDNRVKIIDVESYRLEGLSPKKIENEIWLFPMNDSRNLLIYNVDTDSFREKEYPVKNLPKEEVCLHMPYNKAIWILANKQKKIYRINSNLKIESEVSISDFNKDEGIVYVSGAAVGYQFFWHGHSGTPLIHVKNNTIQMLDVSKNIKIENVYLEMLEKRKVYRNISDRSNIGKRIYNVV